jgi:hypothetical protein
MNHDMLSFIMINDPLASTYRFLPSPSHSLPASTCPSRALPLRLPDPSLHRLAQLSAQELLHESASRKENKIRHFTGSSSPLLLFNASPLLSALDRCA